MFELYDWNRTGQAENERLRQELARITEQRDILKKAVGILSEPSPGGMPGLKRRTRLHSALGFKDPLSYESNLN